MRHEVSFADGVGMIKCLREFTFEDGEKALAEVVDAPWRRQMRRLIIVDEGSAFNPSREEIGRLKELMDEILSSEGVMIAIVVNKIVHFGIGRVIEARVDPGGRVRVFMNELAAREWLGVTSPPQGSE